MTSLDEIAPTATRTVLLTGTSSGIGYASALAAARAGWTVIATMRDLSRADALSTAAADAGCTSTSVLST